MKCNLLGYTTCVKLADQGVICTACSLTINQTLLQSSGSFNNGIKDGEKIYGLNAPFRMGVPQCTLSLSFQATHKSIEKVLGLLKKRNQSCKIKIENINAEKYELDKCYWNSININVVQHALMAITINFNVFMTYDQLYKIVAKVNDSDPSQKINNDYGHFGNQCNCTIIPYYATKIDNIDNLLSWSLDFSQTVTPKYFCKRIVQANSLSSSSASTLNAPIAEKFIFGILSSNLKITCINHNLSSKLDKTDNKIHTGLNDKLFEDNNAFEIKYLDDNLSEKRFVKLDLLQMKSYIPQFTNTGDFISYSLEYQSHKIQF